MKNRVDVWDLDAPDVEISKEDSEVFALVNRGNAGNLADHLLVKDGDSIYITTKDVLRNSQNNPNKPQERKVD